MAKWFDTFSSTTNPVRVLTRSVGLTAVVALLPAVSLAGSMPAVTEPATPDRPTTMPPTSAGEGAPSTTTPPSSEPDPVDTPTPSDVGEPSRSAAVNEPSAPAVEPTATSEASAHESATIEPGASGAEASSEPGLFEAAVSSNDGGGLFEQAVAGESESTEPTQGATPSSGLSFGLHGHVRGDAFVGKTVGYVQPDIKAAYGEAALFVDARKGSVGRGVADLRLRYGFDGSQVVTRLDVREAYADWFLGRLDVRMGQQIIVWGRADGINPTNVLTPIDMRVRSPNEDDRRMGNVGLRLNLDLRPVRVETVWMPLFVPTQWPALDIGSDIEIAQPEYPSPRLANGLGAGRVHLELPSFEMSGMYAYGHATLPGLTYQDYDLISEPPVVRISRTAYQHHVAGFDFSTAIGDLFGLRGEAAYRLPIDYDTTIHTPNPDLQYVAGVDREFGNLSLIAQYYGRYVFDWQELPDPRYDVDLAELAALEQPLSPLVEEQFLGSVNDQLAIRNRILHAQIKPVQHSISLRAEYKALHERLIVSAFGMGNVSTGEWLLYPKVAYSITDGLLASLGGEIYMGPTDTLLGLVDEALSAGYIELKAMF